MKRTVVLGAFLVLAAVHPASAQVLAMQGEQIARQWCAHCHQVSEDTVARDVAPSFLGLAMRNPDDLNWVRTRLQTPLYPMAGINLSNPQIEAIIAYFETLQDQ